jgi:aerobic carbon-monoxide dehydrogenase large subunit
VGIRNIDRARAKALPGVALILTGNDSVILALGLKQPWAMRSRRDGSPAFNAPQPLLARYIGDPVALIVAKTAQAKTLRKRSRSTTRRCRR